MHPAQRYSVTWSNPVMLVVHRFKFAGCEGTYTIGRPEDCMVRCF